MFSAIGSTGYNVMLFLHILTAFVAFAPAFVLPLIMSRSNGPDASSRKGIVGQMAKNDRRIYAPALILTGLFGFGLQGMSDSVFEFGQAWVWLAVVVWIGMNGVLHAVLIPAERALAGGDEPARKRVDTAGMVLTLMLLVMLYLMVFKPGL